MTQIIKGTTKLLGVIGHPVEHSLSPVMHNAAIADLGVDYVYLPLPIKPEDLDKAIAGFEAIGLVGFNITIPHKQSILPLLNHVSPEAEMIGAVNTVWRNGDGWSGTNTDVKGFVSPLQDLQKDWSQVTPIILGNGGAARAVVVGCWQLGCSEIIVVGRNQDKLKRFKQSWQNTPLHNLVKINIWSDLQDLVGQTQLLVNTTPVGMYPYIDSSPMEAKVMAKLAPQAIAYDLIYTPNPTKFLQQAQNRGAIAISGLEMLVQQGAAALEIWLQQSVPVDVMRESIFGLG